MHTHFLNLPDQEQRHLLEQSAYTLGMPATILEKDLWLCWILEQLFVLDIPMVFKGGTSLSKAFNLIHRLF